MTKEKQNGQIYTPDYLVNIILTQGHYVLGNIRKKHVIDNSCGNGQFMVQIVDLYCKDFLTNNSNLALLKTELETYIHAIEKDETELKKCINRCSKVAQKYNIDNVKWDFLCADTLSVTRFNEKMDFVVGNPPYVRVHNLQDRLSSVKTFEFSNSGMTDLYIVFYELGIKMLNKNGSLCYITPSSFFTSIAGKVMRKYLIYNNLLESICDLKHFQAFDATTYTTIVCLKKNNSKNYLQYFEFNEKTLKPVFIENLVQQQYYLNHNFYFSNSKNLKLLQDILCNFHTADVAVKNGYATLADKVFINNFNFESKFIIPVIKASKGKKQQIIYPYTKDSKLESETNIQADTSLYSYLTQHKEALLERSIDKSQPTHWFAFGRSQGINDTYKDKITLNTLVKDANDLKICFAPAGTGVYSGLYILFNSAGDYENIKNALLAKDFSTYISLLGKYKSGGYYTFSSKDIKIYLDYKLR